LDRFLTLSPAPPAAALSVPTTSSNCHPALCAGTDSSESLSFSAWTRSIKLAGVTGGQSRSSSWFPRTYGDKDVVNLCELVRHISLQINLAGLTHCQSCVAWHQPLGDLDSHNCQSLRGRGSDWGLITRWEGWVASWWSPRFVHPTFPCSRSQDDSDLRHLCCSRG